MAISSPADDGSSPRAAWIAAGRAGLTVALALATSSGVALRSRLSRTRCAGSRRVRSSRLSLLGQMNTSVMRAASILKICCPQIAIRVFRTPLDLRETAGSALAGRRIRPYLRSPLE